MNSSPIVTSYAVNLRKGVGVQLYVLVGGLESRKATSMRVWCLDLAMNFCEWARMDCLTDHVWKEVKTEGFSPPARRFSSVCEYDKVLSSKPNPWLCIGRANPCTSKHQIATNPQYFHYLEVLSSKVHVLTSTFKKYSLIILHTYSFSRQVWP